MDNKKIVKKPLQFSRTFLKELLPTNAIIIEAGSHEGNDAIKLATLFKEGHIHAFEPLPDVYATLEKKCSLYKNISTYNQALGDINAHMELYTTPGIFSTTSSLLKPLPAEHHNRSYDTITVPVTTLQNWATHQNITHIDFMWLDAQGTELAILHGANPLFTTARSLLIEVNTHPRYEQSPLKKDIIAYVKQYNFEIMLEHLHHGSWGNILFYNTEKIVLGA